MAHKPSKLKAKAPLPSSLAQLKETNSMTNNNTKMWKATAMITTTTTHMHTTTKIRRATTKTKMANPVPTTNMKATATPATVAVRTAQLKTMENVSL